VERAKPDKIQVSDVPKFRGSTNEDEQLQERALDPTQSKEIPGGEGLMVQERWGRDEDVGAKT
jgi:hypothetical protein